MKLPRNLSGRQLIALLCGKWGYRVLHQEGSHAVLETGTPSKHRVTVPDHRVLRIGTLNCILRAVAVHKGVLRDDILSTLWGCA